MDAWATVAIFIVIIFLCNNFMNNKKVLIMKWIPILTLKKSIILIITKRICLPRRNTLFT